VTPIGPPPPGRSSVIDPQSAEKSIKNDHPRNARCILHRHLQWRGAENHDPTTGQPTSRVERGTKIHSIRGHQRQVWPPSGWRRSPTSVVTREPQESAQYRGRKASAHCLLRRNRESSRSDWGIHQEFHRSTDPRRNRLCVHPGSGFGVHIFDEPTVGWLFLSPARDTGQLRLMLNFRRNVCHSRQLS